MKNRKLKIHIFSLVGISLIFFLCFIVLSVISDQYITDTIYRNLALSETAIDTYVEHRLEEIRLSLKGFSSTDFTSAEVLSDKLSGLDGELLEGEHLSVVLRDGEFYGDNSYHSLVPISALHTAAKDGFDISYLKSSDGGQCVLYLLSTDNEELFLAYGIPLPQFFEGIFSSITMDSDYLAVYNDTGKTVYVSSENHSNISGSLIASLETSMTNQNSAVSGSKIENLKQKSYFRYTLSISQFSGWRIGGIISGDTLLPLYHQVVLIITLVYTACIIFLLLSFLINYLSTRKLSSTVYGQSLDPLTGLLTASSLESEIDRFIKKVDMGDYCLICLDVVAFHRFNTVFDHNIGDDLLRVIGDCLKQEYYCAARINGDVYTFVAPSSANLVYDIEENLYSYVRDSLGESYAKAISFKFGIYPLLDSTFNYRKAYDGATLALKKAKSRLKQNEVFYDRKMQKESEMSKNIEMNMQTALKNEEFELYIQPKFFTVSTICCGGEALIRWDSKTMGFLSPIQFIPLFEQNGFIVDVDFYMLEAAMKHMQRQYDLSKRLLSISVNQSPITISHPDYLERLEVLVDQFSFPIHYIELEITESALTDSQLDILELIHTIRNLGFSVAMDDFGSGFSSLNVLRNIPVDVLKIDKEFLKESDTSVKGRKIIENVINMSKDLEIVTVCEGVETETQLDFLKTARCDIVQGFYFSEPMPYSQYEKSYLTE